MVDSSRAGRAKVSGKSVAGYMNWKEWQDHRNFECYHMDLTSDLTSGGRPRKDFRRGVMQKINA